MCSALVFHNARLKFNEASRQLTAATLLQWGEISSIGQFLFLCIFVISCYLPNAQIHTVGTIEIVIRGGPPHLTIG